MYSKGEAKAPSAAHAHAYVNLPRQHSAQAADYSHASKRDVTAAVTDAPLATGGQEAVTKHGKATTAQASKS